MVYNYLRSLVDLYLVIYIKDLERKITELRAYERRREVKNKKKISY